MVGTRRQLANAWMAHQQIELLKGQLIETQANLALTEIMLAQTQEELTQTQTELTHARKLATIDPLTQLFTQTVFDRDLVATINTYLHDEGHEPVVVGFIDLDGLKAVNDTRGHQAGDDMINSYATKMRAALRTGDRFYRRGASGDEFMLIVETHDPQMFRHRIKLYQDLFDLPVKGPEPQTSFSIGYAVIDAQFLASHYPGTPRKEINAACVAKTLADIADQDMYQNKHVVRKTARGQVNDPMNSAIPTPPPAP